MYSQYLSLAKELALAAGKIMQEGGELEVREKGPADFVTNVDTAIEKMVRGRLTASTGSFGILGEEGAGEQGEWSEQLEREYCWVLDPLDGTANFAFQMPHYAFSLALLHNTEPVVGVVFDPSRNEMFYAEKGKGAFLNDRQIHVSKKSDSRSSIIAVGLASTAREYLEQNKYWYAKVFEHFGKVRSLGASALDLSWLAAGRIDAFLQIRIKPWDVAAAAIICKEAGAALCSLQDARKIEFKASAGSIFCSNQLIFTDFFK